MQSLIFEVIVISPGITLFMRDT